MGFSFRRSSELRAIPSQFLECPVLVRPVGVKGARVTFSPRGKTYITVGGGGFSYRQNLSSGNRPSTAETAASDSQSASVYP